MHNVTVNVCSPDQNIFEQWEALSRRAVTNVFMNPAALKIAHETKFSQMHMLLAWLDDVQPKRLIGIWAMRKNNIMPLWPSCFEAPPYNYAFLSNPVIDPDFMGEVVAAFLNTIAQDQRLPNVIYLRYLDAQSESYGAILNALAVRGAHTSKLLERDRPFITKEFGLKISGSTRKKLRQDWNRLCALGKVEILNDRSQHAAKDSFEAYLNMELSSWKGARGTALLSKEGDATFARRLIEALAAERSASVALLKLDGRAIAAQVLLYCGSTAYTWKTAFTADFGKFSPGTLLIDKMSKQLFANEGIEAIESCSPEGGFMNHMWHGRRATVDLLADLGPGKSIEFKAVAMGLRSYGRLRKIRDGLRETVVKR